MTSSRPDLAPARPSHVSRRALLTSAVAGASAPVWSGFAGALAPAADAATLPLVTPKSSQSALESFGVCAMPTHDTSVYKYRSAWVEQLSNLGVASIRGAYADGFAPTYEAVSLLRQHGMKWGMVVLPDLSMSDAAIQARIADIANKAADVCLFVEGINEPNYNRDGSRVRTDWKQVTLAKQKVIWSAVRSHASLANVKVLGPSLQMNEATTSDYKWFADNGLVNYMTHAGSHCYPGGYYPDKNFAPLLAPLKTYWGSRPIWITETGYNNALASTSGPKAVPEDVAGVYAPSVLLEAVDHGYGVDLFEALDDLDSGSKDNVQANYGLFGLQAGMAPPWRAKPAATALRSLLTGLADPGPRYAPKAVALRVTSSATDVRWTALGKRDGSVRLYLRRSKPIFDPIHRVRINVPSVSVAIQTASGNRTVSVGPNVVTVRL